jgi:hypothetical protein
LASKQLEKAQKGFRQTVEVSIGGIALEQLRELISEKQNSINSIDEKEQPKENEQREKLWKDDP